MKYYGYIKHTDTKYIEEIKSDIESYVQSTDENNSIIEFLTNKEDDTPIKSENHIYNIIDKSLHVGDSLIIVNLLDLGNSLLSILRTLEKANIKNVSIYSITEKIHIYSNDVMLHKIITEFLNIDFFIKKEKLISSAKTRKKNGTKLGRKSGKKTKSMFDKHKKKILKLNNLGMPKIKILNEIKKNDIELKNTSPQALGQYIKKVKLKESASSSYKFKRNSHPVIK